MSLDRLVELFVQSARPDGAGSSGASSLDEEAIDRGVDTVEKMLTSKDAVAMGGSPAATFVCLGMALEEKPGLGLGAVRCYEKALRYLPDSGRRGSSWERTVVLQQLGMICLRQRRLDEADRRLAECAAACAQAEGHPRDAALFGGAFSTQQTRLEFSATVEKLRAKACMELGDEARSRAHIAEAKRLEEAATGDAVDRVSAGAPLPGTGGAARAPGAPGEDAASRARTLWAAGPKEERRVTQYRFVDEGPTVSLILELNDHLGIGAEASDAVDSLRQFRVRCEPDAVDVRLRLRCADSGSICEFRLLLQPLAQEIVPEDTVPRLRGRESKRRLEVKLFKRDKDKRWLGDLVSEGKPQAEQPRSAPAAKGTLLNPLSAEELARLPRPSGAGADNRPSSWQQAASEAVPPALPAAAAPIAAAAATEVSHSAEGDTAISKAGSGNAVACPPWVAHVEQHAAKDEVELLVHLGPAAGADVGMKDLGLDADPVAGVLRLTLLRGSGPGAAPAEGADGLLELRLPGNADAAALVAKWRRKTRVLELHLPQR